jgi:SAM-dependent methyltransferase
MRTNEREYLRERETWSPVNPLALFYRHLFEEELARLFRREGINLAGKKIVEAGCGYGEKTRLLIELGAQPEEIYAFDTDIDVLGKAGSTINGPVFSLTDGTALPYANDTFDVAVLFLYMSVLEPTGVRPRAKAEITRVLKPEGFILWYDTLEKGGGYLWGLEPKEIEGLFPGCRLELHRFGLKYRWTIRTVYKSFETARLLARSGIAKSHVIGIIKPKF